MNSRCYEIATIHQEIPTGFALGMTYCSLLDFIDRYRANIDRFRGVKDAAPYDSGFTAGTRIALSEITKNLLI